MDAAGESEPSGIAIRRARPADLRACLALFDALQDVQTPMWVFEPWPDVRERIEARYRRLQDDADAIHLVADDAGTIVGQGIGEVVPASRISAQRALEISNVVVLPSCRRRGIARRLVDGLAAFGAERDVPWLMLRTFAGNEGALAFWEELGFRPRLVQLAAPAGRVWRPPSGE